MKISSLIEYRKLKGLSIEEFARNLDVSKRTVIRWEQGYTKIPDSRLVDLEKQTGIPRQELRPDLYEAAQ